MLQHYSRINILDQKQLPYFNGIQSDDVCIEKGQKYADNCPNKVACQFTEALAELLHSKLNICTVFMASAPDRIKVDAVAQQVQPASRQ